MPRTHSTRCRQAGSSPFDLQFRCTSNSTTHPHIVKVETSEAHSECFHDGFAGREPRGE